MTVKSITCKSRCPILSWAPFACKSLIFLCLLTAKAKLVHRSGTHGLAYADSPSSFPISSIHLSAACPDDIQQLGTGQSFVLTLPAMEGAKEHSAIVKIGREVKFSLRTRDPQLAKLRAGIVLERLARGVGRVSDIAQRTVCKYSR